MNNSMSSTELANGPQTATTDSCRSIVQVSLQPFAKDIRLELLDSRENAHYKDGD